MKLETVTYSISYRSLSVFLLGRRNTISDCTHVKCRTIEQCTTLKFKRFKLVKESLNVRYKIKFKGKKKQRKKEERKHKEKDWGGKEEKEGEDIWILFYTENLTALPVMTSPQEHAPYKGPSPSIPRREEEAQE